MNNIKLIEKEIKYWKAEKGNEKNRTVEHYFLDGMIEGLKKALAIIKQPSNTAMHVDTKPCNICDSYKLFDNDEQVNFCVNCGEALSK